MGVGVKNSKRKLIKQAHPHHAGLFNQVQGLRRYPTSHEDPLKSSHNETADLHCGKNTKNETEGVGAGDWEVDSRLLAVIQWEVMVAGSRISQ